MKKTVLILALALVVGAAWAQTPYTITGWASQELLPTDPVDYSTQMAGGVIVGSNLYIVGGIYSGGGAVDSDVTWRIPINAYSGAPQGAMQQTPLPNTDSYAYLFETVAATDTGLYIAQSGFNFTGPNLNYATYIDILPDGSLGAAWMQAPNYPTIDGTNLFEPELGAAVICDNGYLYTFGGDSQSGTPARYNDVLYSQIQGDGSLGAWTQAADLPGTFWFPGAATIDNYIIATGGYFDGTTRDTSTDRVWVCQVNPDGTMGSWVEGPQLPEPAYNYNFEAVGDTVFCIGGRDNVGGLSKTNVWRATFNSTTGTLSAWQTVDAQLPIGVRYHDVAYSAESKRLYVFSIRSDDTTPSIPNLVLISSPLADPPIPSATDEWTIYN